MAYIKLYKNNPTAGAQDGTAVSQDGTQTAPVTVTLDASRNESAKIKLALRADAGYATDGNPTVTAVGTNADKWTFSATENGTFMPTFVFGTNVTDVNNIFYAQAASSSVEAPQRDVSVSINVKGVVEAV